MVRPSWSWTLEGRVHPTTPTYTCSSRAPAEHCGPRAERNSPARRLSIARWRPVRAWTASGRDQEWPIVVKSRRSRRGDLVCVIRSSAELHALAADWANEPLVAQRIVRHDGWEHKVWVIGGDVYRARRRSQFGAHGSRAAASTPVEQPADAIADLARAVGVAFGLDLYGVDVLVGERGPVVVDVNAFPGFRRVPSAGELVAAHVMRLTRREAAPA
jgi:ribosomal protein S6--L-glutamate ligase